LNEPTIDGGFRVIPNTQLVKYGIVDSAQDGAASMEQANQSSEQRAASGK
jgi:hypothetical protein